ncbi:hypothetical protein GWK47_037340 [Chionoecetes opilio]|uniref:Uncharacterized protein n=1 Tax=Chionoecetes opilio TaxID=41210 RepID=A0A8J4YN61_CHIOP|nr:hypothetical protein GWK47_037340 [Chionoecetes opilio]
MKQLLGEKYNTFDPSCSNCCLPNVCLLLHRRTFCVKNSLDPDAIAKLADDFVATIPTPQVSTVSSVTTQDNTQLAQLTKLVSQLTTEVTSSSSSSRLKSPPSTGRSRYANDPAPPPLNTASTVPLEKPGLCWYHINFGNRASKCHAPCSYKASNQKGEY